MAWWNRDIFDRPRSVRAWIRGGRRHGFFIPSCPCCGDVRLKNIDKRDLATGKVLWDKLVPTDIHSIVARNDGGCYVVGYRTAIATRYASFPFTVSSPWALGDANATSKPGQFAKRFKMPPYTQSGSGEFRVIIGADIGPPSNPSITAWFPGNATAADIRDAIAAVLPAGPLTPDGYYLADVGAHGTPYDDIGCVIKYRTPTSDKMATLPLSRVVMQARNFTAAAGYSANTVVHIFSYDADGELLADVEYETAVPGYATLNSAADFSVLATVDDDDNCVFALRDGIRKLDKDLVELVHVSPPAWLPPGATLPVPQLCGYFGDTVYSRDIDANPFHRYAYDRASRATTNTITGTISETGAPAIGERIYNVRLNAVASATLVAGSGIFLFGVSYSASLGGMAKRSGPPLAFNATAATVAATIQEAADRLTAKLPGTTVSVTALSGDRLHNSEIELEIHVTSTIAASPQISLTLLKSPFSNVTFSGPSPTFGETSLNTALNRVGYLGNGGEGLARFKRVDDVGTAPYMGCQLHADYNLVPLLGQITKNEQKAVIMATDCGTADTTDVIACDTAGVSRLTGKLFCQPLSADEFLRIPLAVGWFNQTIADVGATETQPAVKRWNSLGSGSGLRAAVLCCDAALTELTVTELTDSVTALTLHHADAANTLVAFRSNVYVGNVPLAKQKYTTAGGLPAGLLSANGAATLGSNLGTVVQTVGPEKRVRVHDLVGDTPYVLASTLSAARAIDTIGGKRYITDEWTGAAADDLEIEGRFDDLGVTTANFAGGPATTTTLTVTSPADVVGMFSGLAADLGDPKVSEYVITYDSWEYLPETPPVPPAGATAPALTISTVNIVATNGSLPDVATVDVVSGGLNVTLDLHAPNHRLTQQLSDIDRQWTLLLFPNFPVAKVTLPAVGCQIAYQFTNVIANVTTNATSSQVFSYTPEGAALPYITGFAHNVFPADFGSFLRNNNTFVADGLIGIVSPGAGGISGNANSVLTAADIAAQPAGFFRGTLPSANGRHIRVNTDGDLVWQTYFGTSDDLESFAHSQVQAHAFALSNDAETLFMAILGSTPGTLTFTFLRADLDDNELLLNP